MPKSKKKYYLKSYIPSSKIWNEIELNVKQAETENILLSKLMGINDNSSHSLFLYCDGKGT